MKKTFPIILAFGLVILFFIQSAGTLVESIYILDLMNSTLDAKVLGLLFFFAPLLLLPFYARFPRGLVWLLFAVLLMTRGAVPYLNTSNRVLAAGLATGASASLLLLLFAAKPKGESQTHLGLWGSAGLGLAVSLSVLLRTVGDGIELSLTPSGGWIGWGLTILLGWPLTQLDFTDWMDRTEKNPEGVTIPLLGLFLVITLIWFSFSAPAVIARWTDGNYALILILVSLFATAFVLLSLIRPQWLDRVSREMLIIWNILFTIALTATILSHRIAFPPMPDSAPVVVTSPSPLAQILLFLMLLLFPVIFLDMRLFLGQMQQSLPRPGDLAPGILLSALTMVLLVFFHIFTNVWGYVAPVSTPFRNQFHLPYLLLAGLISLLVWRAKKTEPTPEKDSTGSFHWSWAVLLSAVFLVTAVKSVPAKRMQVDSSGKHSLIAMTFNVQQFNDDAAEKSFERQIELIRKASPDILSMQETDSARISLNNNDYVRYFAEKLGYYSYYGPTTVTGTYGTTILSKYPLLDTRSIFSFSDTDEIGIAEAEIEINGIRFSIYDVHPDGSDTAMMAFAKTLLEQSKDKPYVIALGDYNLRDYQEPYKLIDSVYVNAWTSAYPSEISPDGVDMSGDNRIDHIFVSPTLGVRNPIYVLPPESATDHPVHWAEIYWQATP